MVKVCSKCHAELPMSGFRKGRAECKACSASYNAEYYAANREKVRVAGAVWRAANPEKRKAGTVRRAARLRAQDFFGRRAHTRHGIPADESRAIWKRQGGKCALTGRLLRQDGSSELDHIVSLAEGGRDGAHNRQWVCKTANRLKGNLSDPEFVRFCLEVATHYQDNLLTPLSYTGTAAVWMSALMAAE